MPFGSITIANRLGVSNSVYHNAVSFGETVLRLPDGFPVYQAQLVHSPIDTSGPAAAAAEWCAYGIADDDIDSSYVIREISAHSTYFGRRNLSYPQSLPQPPNQDRNFEYHRQNYTNQIFYVTNEPESYSQVNGTGCVIWDPPDRTIDELVDDCFLPDPNNTFWEGTVNKRAKANVLAYLYAYLKNRAGGSHVVLLPSAAEARLGRHPGVGGFWLSFFNNLHSANINAGSCSIPGIAVDGFPALHIHRYTDDPFFNPTFTTLYFVAKDAAVIKDGLDWYNDTHRGGGSTPFPFDLLISEMGLKWNMDVTRKWSAGFPDFRKALTWWNTYLAWLTRLAPTITECNLMAGKTVHALIHDPARSPYVAHIQSPPNNAPPGTTLSLPRNQDYLNINTMQVETFYDANALTILTAGVSNPPYPGAHTYQNSFVLSQNLIRWVNKNFRTLPLGACFTVWAHIGNDAVTNNLNTGWLDTSVVGGDTYTVSLSLDEGFQTVFFPVMKKQDLFNPSSNPSISLTWSRSQYELSHGYMALHDFEDFADNIVVDLEPGTAYQDVYPAMVYPVVVYCQPTYSVTLTLTRNFSQNVLLGRPIVLKGICSWFIDQ